MKFIQIATSTDAENGESFYALGDDGCIYQLAPTRHEAGEIVNGKPLLRRALSDVWWQKMNYPFKEPPIEDFLNDS